MRSAMGDNFDDMLGELGAADQEEEDLRAADGEAEHSSDEELHDVPDAVDESHADVPANSCALPDAWLKLKHVYGRERVEKALGLRVTPSSDVVNEDGDQLGKIYFSWGHTLSATCKAHRLKNCKCLISMGKTTHERADSDLIKWLAVGASSTFEAHQELGREIRISNGMKVRPS